MEATAQRLYPRRWQAIMTAIETEQPDDDGNLTVWLRGLNAQMFADALTAAGIWALPGEGPTGRQGLLICLRQAQGFEGERSVSCLPMDASAIEAYARTEYDHSILHAWAKMGGGALLDVLEQVRPDDLALRRVSMRPHAVGSIAWDAPIWRGISVDLAGDERLARGVVEVGDPGRRAVRFAADWPGGDVLRARFVRRYQSIRAAMIRAQHARQDELHGRLAAQGVA